MAEIINLRVARKARKRSEAEQAASENRARFGMTRAARDRQRQEADWQARLIDGAHREPEGKE